jgi:hypothetical protein
MEASVIVSRLLLVELNKVKTRYHLLPPLVVLAGRNKTNPTKKPSPQPPTGHSWSFYFPLVATSGLQKFAVVTLLRTAYLAQLFENVSKTVGLSLLS